MTTEDDFQAALDREPGDWQTRLVFADWLEERGDARAAGMRASGLHRVRPAQGASGPTWVWWEAEAYSYPFPPVRLTCDVCCAMLPRRWHPQRSYRTICTEYATRREAEDAAALAFAKLPPNRRAELLVGV